MIEQDKIKKSIESSKIGGWFEKAILITSVLMVIGLYWRWLLPGAIAWGDWFYLTKSSLRDTIPSLWSTGFGAGALGDYSISAVPFFPVVILSNFLCRFLNLDNAILERLFIFGPLVLFFILSPWYLARTLKFGRIAQAAMILVFNLNTTMFMNSTVPLLDLSDAMAPLVFALFIREIRQPYFKNGLLFGLLLALQMVVEVRGCYITLFFCGFYFLYHIIIDVKIRDNLNRTGKTLVLSAAVAILLHSYWIIPLLFGRMTNSAPQLLPGGYRVAGALQSLSYMTLLHSLGLSHPFWGRLDMLNPVNPRFLLLPIIAFSVLLFGKQKRLIIFFAISALIFSFLVKGSNPPFGSINIWLFLHFPGFFMFRAPGKWSMPLIISYSVLVGFLVEQIITREFISHIFSRLSKQFSLRPFITKAIILICAVAVIFIVFPVQPISTLRYSAIFEPRKVPVESAYLENFLESQSEFFRSLWVPNLYRFGNFSTQHRAIMGYYIGQDMLPLLCTGNPRYQQYIFSYLGKFFTPELLRLLSVKYIILPSAPRGEGFIYYWYSLPPEYYKKLIEKTPEIIPVGFKGESKIYELPDPLPLFYTSAESQFIAADYDDILPLIFRINYINRKPVVIVSRQNLKPEDSLLSSKDFLLQNRNVEDFAVEFSESIKIPFSDSTEKHWQRKEVKIDKAGSYELWVDYSKLEIENAGSAPIRIMLDKKVICDYGQEKGLIKELRSCKYVKLVELNLKAGRHTIDTQIKRQKSQLSSYSMMLLVYKLDRLKAKIIISNKLNQSAVRVRYIFDKSSDFTLN